MFLRIPEVAVAAFLATRDGAATVVAEYVRPSLFARVNNEDSARHSDGRRRHSDGRRCVQGGRRPQKTKAFAVPVTAVAASAMVAAVAEEAPTMARAGRARAATD